MDNNQVRLVARCVENPSKLGDIMPESFGDEGGGEGEKKDVRSASCERGSHSGRSCRKIEIEEVDIRPTGGKGSEQDPEDQEAWEKEIGKAEIGCAYGYSDDSLSESENGGGIDNG